MIKGVFRACLNVSRPHAFQKGACCTTLLQRTESVRSAIAPGITGKSHSHIWIQYEARSDWGVIRTGNVGPINPSARALSMVDVANSMPVFGIWGPPDGVVSRKYDPR